jgi:hypothetical protein
MQAQPPPEREPPTKASTPAPKPLVSAASPTYKTPSRAPALRIGIGLHGTAGTAPSPALGGSLHASVRWPLFSLGVEGRADAPAGASASQGGRVSSALLGASVLPCVHADPLFLCAHGLFGALNGTGEGVSSPQRATTVYVALGARVGAEIPLSRRWALRTWADLLGTVTPTTLTLDSREVWTTPLVSGTLGVGALMRFL